MRRASAFTWTENGIGLIAMLDSGLIVGNAEVERVYESYRVFGNRASIAGEKANAHGSYLRLFRNLQSQRKIRIHQ